MLIRVDLFSISERDDSFEVLPESGSVPETSSILEDEPKSHRLQRQKFQSRKTFRFRKSRKGNLEVGNGNVFLHK